MKTKHLFRIAPFVVGILVLAPLCSFNSGSNDDIASAQGQASSVGSPGELGTCSRSTCHGAGSGGLADNAGPGSVTWTSVPAMTFNQYAAGQVYHMTVTVAETGKTHFGFELEMLDNSGSTNGHINNSLGTLAVTDAAHTRIWQAFGTGRLSLGHNSTGGIATNTCSFIFDWTAPSSGTVNMYLAGNASNNNGLADAADNVYTIQQQLNPMITGVAEKEQEVFTVSAFPVPTRDILNIRCKVPVESNLLVGLFNSNGLLIRTLDNRNLEAGPYTGSYTVSDLAKGLYLLRITCGNETRSKTILIE
jgi:predicted CxxxxCH...CXXCH cytochrome family protein